MTKIWIQTILVLGLLRVDLFAQVIQIVDLSLVRVAVDSSGNNHEIDVSFRSSAAKGIEPYLKSKDNWRVIKRLTDGAEIPSALVADPIVAAQAVHLEVAKISGESIDHFIVVFTRLNYPSISTRPSAASAPGTFEAATGKSDADIYLSGSLTASGDAKPVYNIDTKVGYIERLGNSKNWMGFRSALVASEGTDIDPDSINVFATAERIVSFGGGWSWRGTWDVIGGEFDRKNKIRNLAGTVLSRVTLPALLNGTSEKTIDLVLGDEFGKNLKASDPRNPRRFSRFVAGADVRIKILKSPLFSKLTFSAEYRVRIPSTDEPFLEKTKAGDKILSFTSKSRHHLLIETTFKVTPAVGITAKYRYGSLPPLFSLIKHQTTVGISVALKQKVS